VLKREEKSRASVTDGVPLQLPALTLHAKMRRKALAVGLEPVSGPHSRERAIDSLTRLTVLAEPAGENDGAASAESAWAELIVAVSDLARWSGVDLEGVLRRRSLALREEIIAEEAKNPFVSSD
jgi:hypothetical protein